MCIRDRVDSVRALGRLLNATVGDPALVAGVGVLVVVPVVASVPVAPATAALSLPLPPPPPHAARTAAEMNARPKAREE